MSSHSITHGTEKSVWLEISDNLWKVFPSLPRDYIISRLLEWTKRTSLLIKFILFKMKCIIFRRYCPISLPKPFNEILGISIWEVSSSLRTNKQMWATTNFCQLDYNLIFLLWIKSLQIYLSYQSLNNMIALIKDVPCLL